MFQHDSSSFSCHASRRSARSGYASVELLLVAVTAVIGLLVAMTAIRDAVISEVSDIGGSLQDSNQSFAINGVAGATSSVAGMDFQDVSDIADDADDNVGGENQIEFNVTTTTESFSRGRAVGHDTVEPARHLDSWRSNMVIDEGQAYTNTGANANTIHITDFSFYAGREGILTPFVVKVYGDNRFVVAAIGDVVAVTAPGDQTHGFASANASVELLPGETLAVGFMDAKPDGSGGGQSVIRFDYTSNEIWYSGGPHASHAGSIEVGSSPDRGSRVLTNQRRDYQFQIGIEVPLL